MIEIRPITPEDAAAVGRLLQQLGYAVEPLQVSGRIGQLPAPTRYCSRFRTDGCSALLRCTYTKWFSTRGR
jgi:hypothetical protein